MERASASLSARLIPPPGTNGVGSPLGSGSRLGSGVAVGSGVGVGVGLGLGVGSAAATLKLKVPSFLNTIGTEKPEADSVT